MLVVCLSALVLHKAGRWRAFTRYAPTLLTSLGILGTFTGVVTGLLDFDSTIDNIDRSISLLLEGLKTAFISSLVGMGLSILYKILVSLPWLAPPSTGRVAEFAATIDDLYDLQRRQTADQAELLDAVKGQSERPLFDRFVELHRKLEDRATARHTEQLDLHKGTATKVLELLGSIEGAGRSVDGTSVADRLAVLTADFARHVSESTEASERAESVAREGFSVLRLGADDRAAVLRKGVELKEATLEADKHLLEAVGSLTMRADRHEGFLRCVAESVRTEDGQGIAEQVGRLAVELAERAADACAVRERGISIVETGFAGLDTVGGKLLASGQRSIEVGEEIADIERSCAIKLDGVMLTTEHCVTALADPESIDGLAWQLARLRSETQVGDEVRQESSTRREALLKELGESITTWRETANERGAESLLIARHALESNVRGEKATVDLGETVDTWKQGSEAHTEAVAARLETFEDLLSQSAGEEIVKALEGVIREFNERLSEQFGKNFQELNAAVGRLLTWQDNYRDQLADMRAQYDVSVRALQDSERAMAAIGEESGKIPAYMDRLGEVITVNQHQIDELAKHLSAFADVHGSAVEAVPEIKAIVDRTVEELAGATKSLTEGVESGAGSMRAAIERSVTDYEKATASVNVQAREIAQRTHEEVTASFDRLRGTLQKTFEESQSGITALISKEFQNMAETRRQLSLDEMTTMSNALLKVTGRFTEDYSALVEAMGRVVDQHADGSR